MYWLIKNGVLCYSVEELPIKKEYFTKKEMDKKINSILENEELTEDEKNYKISILSNVKVDWIDYDEAIEYNFDWPPEYINWQIVESTIYKSLKMEAKKKEIVFAEDLNSVDIEWFEFSDYTIWEIITDRVFGWNPYAQQALQAKVLEVLMQWIAWNVTPEGNKVLEKAEYIKQEINKVRIFFGLSPI